MSMPLNGFRPMKSASPPQDFDFSTLSYPMWASPKIDGIRCVIHPTLGPVTNTLKKIPNTFTREYLQNHCPKYLDGELVVGDPDNPKSFNQTQSGIMSHDGTPDFTYLVFDNFESGHMCGFGIRKEDAKAALDFAHMGGINNRLQLLHQTLIESHEQLLEYELEQLAKGYEGVMLRSPNGKYKFGRSTLREQGMIKIKRFRDDEAIIIDWEPLERNLNVPQIDNLGLQRRGYSKDGKAIDDSRVGRFLCRGVPGSRWAGVEFWIGSGLDDTERVTFREALRKYNITSGDQYPESVLTHPKDYPPDLPIGKTITFKYQEHGSIDAPRTPIWKGIRYDI